MRVQLRNEELAVETEEVGVGPKEGLRVSLRRQLVGPLLLERGEVLGADSRLPLGIAQLEPLARPRLAQGAADLEHRTRS
jgi:hypothetical protein